MPEQPGRFAVVVTTVSSSDDARRIAEAVVEARLAACVNVLGPIHSTYRWQGRVAHDEERLLIIKTRRGLFERLCEAIRAVHPYEVPELILLPIEAGDPPYLAWLSESTLSGREEP